MLGGPEQEGTAVTRPLAGKVSASEGSSAGAGRPGQSVGAHDRRLWKLLRPHMLAVSVLLIGFAASFGAFVLTQESVNHSDELLLRQDAVQSSLVLGSFIGQVPGNVSELAMGISAVGLSPNAWEARAQPVATSNGYSALAVLTDLGGRFVPVASVGRLRRTFGTQADGPVWAALDKGQSPYAATTSGSGGRWLSQWISVPSAAGYVLYSEQPVSDKPISLASLPGHPFSGIQGAVYAGYERPSDLVYSSTSHLPLTGERAVTEISGSSPFKSAPAELSDHVGSLSAPGSYLLVLSPTSSLSGTTAEMLPWILLALGLFATLMVAALLEVSERRRAAVATALGQLEERSADLDRAMVLQQTTAARFSAMVRSSSDLTTVISSDGQIRFQSPSSAALLGVTHDDLLGTSFHALVHPEDRELWARVLAQSGLVPGAEVSEALRLKASNGSYVCVETRITNLVDDPAVSGIVLNSRDVTDQKRLEDELRHQAFHDSLTGLANRALFEDRLENALARLSRTRASMGILFLDLDDFKAVNDGRGHNVGDELLKAVAERLTKTVRAGDTLARIGGDEFAVLVESSDDFGSRETAERILESLKEPITIGTGEASVRASIGVAATNGRQSAQDLLRDADVAMYAAKSAGKGRVEVFHPGLHEEVISRLELEVDLSRALDNEELSVHYQPLVALDTGTVVGMEALMRWTHPVRGMVMPGEFIPVAESTGLIVSIGKWLLLRACSDARYIQQQTGRSDLHVAVNLSARQLEDRAVVDYVEEALERSGLEAGHLTLEITESVFMGDRVRSLGVLERLRSLGVRLSIDDFGTGYSSLGYLNQLPIDELKIDRTFVVAAGENHGSESASLVQTIVRLAQDFGLGTVAEGIETQAQLDKVRESGCELAQGYLFARPVELAEIVGVLAGAQPLVREPIS